jgi:hypothetical protein
METKDFMITGIGVMVTICGALIGRIFGRLDKADDRLNKLDIKASEFGQLKDAVENCVTHPEIKQVMNSLNQITTRIDHLSDRIDRMLEPKDK